MNLYLYMFFILMLVSLVIFSFSMFLMFFNKIIMIEWDVFSLNSVELNFLVLMDWMSTFFMASVLLISGMVIYYSQSYMMNDGGKIRFLLLVMLFVLSMMFMIMSPNMLSILLGWDGLGLVSYCLVIFYQNTKSYNAGMLTILSNRVGDVMILLSIAWLMDFGSWNLLLYMDFMDNYMNLNLISVLICVAALTKSAQIPFSAWLPAAMAAPTPVSALVHSSTLVTAGVYLMIRFSKMMIDGHILKMLMLIGGLTMFMSGVSANFEYDLKKIIALSTLSQLGLMMMILGGGFMELAYFHLLAHAFFKALLFLCAGVLIHSFFENQDIRNMGGIFSFMPLIFSMFMVSNFALCGLPFLSGFFSKDLILEMSSMSVLNLLMYLIMYVSTGLTVSYTVRLMWYSFMMNCGFSSLMSLSQDDYIMVAPMMVLVFMSIVMGEVMNNLLFLNMSFIYLPIILKMMVFLVITGGVMMGVMFYKNYKNMFFMKYFINTLWFLSFLSILGLNKITFYWSFLSWRIIDVGWLENITSNLIMKNMNFYIWKFQFMQFKLMKNYLILFNFWILSFLLW